MVSKEFFLEMVTGKTTSGIEKIEEFVDHYPWCAIGHKSLFAVLCNQNEEAWLSYLSKASAYLFKREELYALAYMPRPVLPVTSEPFFIEVVEKSKTPEKKIVDEKSAALGATERIILVGGDYFSQSELDTTLLEEHSLIDKFIKINPKLTPVQLFQEEQEEKVSLLDVGEDNFMTETLAKIYADQSLYQLAIEAYEKLILLYPKKSDYFASLIQELKFKMNR